MFSALLLEICERRLLKRRLQQIQSDTLPYATVLPIIRTFSMAFDRSRPLILSLAAHFIPSGDSSFEFHQLVTIRFLLDRVTSTPVNILRLVIADPVRQALMSPHCTEECSRPQ